MTVFWLLAACGGGPTSAHVAIDKADARWGGDAFCARTGLGLACWTSSLEAAVARVKGATDVIDVEANLYFTCALERAGGVTCLESSRM